MAEDNRPTETDWGRDLLDDLALCGAAKAGPWTAVRHHCEEVADLHLSTVEAVDGTVVADVIGQEERVNALFIAAAREAWPVPIRQALVGLSTKVYEALAQQGIGTMGDYQEWCANNRLTDLKGVGAEKAEKILEAQEAFWQRQGRKPGEES